MARLMARLMHLARLMARLMHLARLTHPMHLSRLMARLMHLSRLIRQSQGCRDAQNQGAQPAPQALPEESKKSSMSRQGVCRQGAPGCDMSRQDASRQDFFLKSSRSSRIAATMGHHHVEPTHRIRRRSLRRRQRGGGRDGRLVFLPAPPRRAHRRLQANVRHALRLDVAPRRAHL